MILNDILCEAAQQKDGIWSALIDKIGCWLLTICITFLLYCLIKEVAKCRRLCKEFEFEKEIRKMDRKEKEVTIIEKEQSKKSFWQKVRSLICL